MEILEKLFGSISKVKVIKLFLFNRETPYDVADVADWAKIPLNIARKEIHNLERIDFVKKRIFTKDVKVQKNRKVAVVSKKVNGWMLNQKFPYLDDVESFLSNVNPFKNKDMITRIMKAGTIKLLIIAGIFIKSDDSRVDLFIVGTKLSNNLINNVVRNIEAEIGREIRFVVFETTEFQYRHAMFDKLIRDVLDYPHEKIINKLNI